MDLAIFIGKRFIGLILIVTILTVGVFFLSRAIPGDIVAVYVGRKARAEQIEAARRELGLDRPIYIQYIQYVKRMSRGDLGVSFITHRKVTDDLKIKIPITFELIAISWVISLFFGLLFGVISALTEGTLVDQVISILASISFSIPIFFLAVILQLFFFDLLGWFPLQGRIDTMMELMNPIEPLTGFSLIDALVARNYDAFFDVSWHMVLPVMSIAIGYIGYLARMTRASLLEVMSQNYILSARASGISERTLFFWYGLRNAISPILTVMGLAVAAMIGMAFYTEQIFNYPGVGSYAFGAIYDQDYPVLIGVVMLTATIYVISNTLTDIVRKIVDPRIK
jgi:peptide/nickel transport system permease protein